MSTGDRITPGDLPDDVYRMLVERARREDRSVWDQVLFELRRIVADEGKEHWRSLSAPRDRHWVPDPADIVGRR